MNRITKIFQDSNIAPLTLKFKKARLEKSYLAHSVKSSLNQLRVSIALGIFLYSLFAIIDLYFLPDLFVKFLIIRFGIVLPLGALAFYLTYRPNFPRYSQITLSIILLISCLGINVMIANGSLLVNFPYFNGLIFAFFFVYNFVKVTFRLATAIVLIVMIVFEIIIYKSAVVPQEEIVAGNVFLIVGTILSAMSAYYNELIARKEYFYRDFLTKEHQNIQKKNQDLEEIVNERTLELVKANKALTKAKLRAEGNERLKSSFLAIISHEVRTPLTKIVGFSELISKSNIAEEKKANYRKLIEEGADQLLKVLNDIVEMSKIENQNVPISESLFLLNIVIGELEFFFERECEKMGKKGKLKFIINPDLKNEFLIKSDRQKIKRVLENLIQNAIKYTSEGSIRVNVEIRQDNFIEFCISDTGKGIKPEDQEIIFDIYKKVDDRIAQNYGGTGLGLTISKGIVRSLGGKMWVQSEIGKGSEFFFTVPLKKTQ